MIKRIKNIKIKQAVALSLVGLFASAPILNTASAMEIDNNQANSAYNEVLDTEQGNINIVLDNNEKRIAKSNIDGKESIAEFNKIDNTITINENGIKTVIDLSQIEKENEDNMKKTLRSASSVIEQRTITNFEYKIFMGSNKWILRRPKPGNHLTTNEKSVYKNKKNSSTLNNFKDTVDEIKVLEGKYLFYGAGASITTVGSIIASAVTAGAGSGTALAALGLTGSALDCSLNLEKQCKRALYYYFSV